MYRNLATALQSVGATFDDVAKQTVYVVDWSKSNLPSCSTGLEQATTELGITAVRD